MALAGLETVVHLASGSLPLNRYLVRIDIPDLVWKSREIITDKTAPVGWDALPAGKVSLDFGDDWLASLRSALLEVPSVIVPEEGNILVNPLHPDVKGITAAIVRKWVYDARLI
jgi:RES domain-containing protein